MTRDVMLYPTLNEELIKRVRFQKSPFYFYYCDDSEEEHELNAEASDIMSSVYAIKDENGVWTQDDYALCFRRSYTLRTFQCLFGPDGIACEDAELGLAIIWSSADSKQRGVVRTGTFNCQSDIFEITAEKEFEKAQLRGEVTFTTVLYLAIPGKPKEYEQHLANTTGYILGELEKFVIQLDGRGSVFPIFEVSEPGQPLWYVRCDWDDPTTDSFEDTVSINLNAAHKNYRYIDRTQKSFNSQLLIEVMSAAICVIVESARCQSAFWEQIVSNDSLETGSVGQAIYYFKDTLEWDLSSPNAVSLSARKFFEQRI